MLKVLAWASMGVLVAATHTWPWAVRFWLAGLPQSPWPHTEHSIQHWKNTKTQYPPSHALQAPAPGPHTGLSHISTPTSGLADEAKKVSTYTCGALLYSALTTVHSSSCFILHEL